MMEIACSMAELWIEKESVSEQETEHNVGQGS